MDLSKLPKLSETPKPPPEEPQAADTPRSPFAPRQDAPAMGPERFISVAIGLFVVYMSWQVVDFAIHKFTGREFHYPVTDAAGNPMAYTDSIFFRLNLATAVFGLALILDGLIGRPRNASGLWFLVILFGAAAALNVWAVATAMSVVGLQILPALCGAYGIYYCWSHWIRLQAMRER